jgi:plastocyanin
MQRRTLVAAMPALALAPVAVHADEDGNPRMSVTVSFGAGLNTAQPGNAANHHVLPDRIRIKAGGVVNFAVAGFHQIFVYQPGKTPQQVVVPAAGLFIDDLDRLYYQGIVPAGGPPPGTPATTNPSNAENRVEPVSFADPGAYLVICNVRPHFLDGMWAWIVVSR